VASEATFESTAVHKATTKSTVMAEAATKTTPMSTKSTSKSTVVTTELTSGISFPLSSLAVESTYETSVVTAEYFTESDAVDSADASVVTVTHNCVATKSVAAESMTSKSTTKS